MKLVGILMYVSIIILGIGFRLLDSRYNLDKVSNVLVIGGLGMFALDMVVVLPLALILG